MRQRSELQKRLTGERKATNLLQGEKSMSQHDMVIANQAFPAFRSDLNDALAALVSTSSGATAPSTITAGQLWVDTAGTPYLLKMYDGTNSVVVGAVNQSTHKAVPYLYPMEAKTSGFTVGVADRHKIFNCTSGTFTVTLTAAATFADGFVFTVVNSGSGTITIDPNSSETIDGATTLALTPGQRCIVGCDGTGFQTLAKTSSAGTAFGNTVATKTGAYTVISSDLGAEIRATGTAPYTISLTAAATLGNGFIFGLINASDGLITIDPNSSEQIDGATTLVLGIGDSVIVVCNGSAFFSMVKIKSGTAAYDLVRLDATAKLPAVDGSQLTNLPSSGGVGSVEEAAELSSNGMSLLLSGIDTNILAIALGENYQGRPVQVWIGFLDKDTYQLINDPALIFRGRMDTMEIKADQKAEINLICENRLADWDRPRVLRYNNETQKNIFPGDLGLQFAEQAAEKPIYWGRPDALL